MSYNDVLVECNKNIFYNSNILRFKVRTYIQILLRIFLQQFKVLNFTKKIVDKIKCFKCMELIHF
jgi:hypothetical protein